MENGKFSIWLIHEEAGAASKPGENKPGRFSERCKPRMFFGNSYYFLWL